MKTQTLHEHYAELRTRVLVCFANYILCVTACFLFANEIYSFLVQPLAAVVGGASNRHLIFTSLAEGMMTQFKLACFAGFILNFPVLSWQVYAFIAPGLYKEEKAAIIPYVIFSPILFAIGGVFVYYCIIPIAWKFFLSFEMPSADGLPIILEAKISEYLDLVVDFILGFGIAFQLPIVILLLTQLRVLNSKLLKKGRRYAIVLIFIIAAILTPPDVLSQIFLALPLVLLYEISILLSMMKEKRRKQ